MNNTVMTSGEDFIVLSEEQEAVLRELRCYGALTAPQLTSSLELDSAQVHDALQTLAGMHLVSSMPDFNQAEYVYILTDRSEQQL